MISEKIRYVTFLRGINVGGHHKVPMAELREEMENLQLENVITLLNSGNIIFDTKTDDLEHLAKTISEHLEKAFGFPIPTILRTSEMIYGLIKKNPFKNIMPSKDNQLYVSFLRKETETNLQLPWSNFDDSFKIISKTDKSIFSVVDVSLTKTPKGMETLEKYFGADITTRNWNTIKRIEKKLDASR